MQSPMGGKKNKTNHFSFSTDFHGLFTKYNIYQSKKYANHFFWYGHCPRIHKILENVFFQNPRKLMLTNIDKNTVQVLNFLNSKSCN